MRHTEPPRPEKVVSYWT